MRRGIPLCRTGKTPCQPITSSARLRLRNCVGGWDLGRTEKKRRAWLRLAAGVLMCGAALGISAQVNTASLSGFVTDASGAADASVKVTATNGATGYVRTLATDATGFYSFQTMQIGTYPVKVEQPGFATVQEDVVLSVGEKARQDFHLQIGSAQQTVQVQANASLLSPDDASAGTVLGRPTIHAH